MPGTYTQILLHIVFSTRHRTPWINEPVAQRLYPYMGGIIRGEKGTLYDVGGIEDHVHLYLRWRAGMSLSDLMRIVKGQSSKWLHETFPDLAAFAWQEGYSAFFGEQVSRGGSQGVHQRPARTSLEGGLQRRTASNVAPARGRVR